MEEKLMSNYSWITDGSVTSPAGYQAAGVTAGLKRSGAADMAMIYSEKPASFAAAFTSCIFAAAPVLVDKKRAETQECIQAVVVNSGIANACTGNQGLMNAESMCAETAKVLNLTPEQVMVSSTGRIGTQLPMDIINNGISMLAKALTPTGGLDAAKAIMTTDTKCKSVALKVKLSGGEVVIGAMTKGAGMIDPAMRTVPHATMLCYITSDVKTDNGLLSQLLKNAVDDSFNRITVDGDMSTNDTTILMANGASGVKIANEEDRQIFYEALLAVTQNLAKQMVMDGEGATKFVTVLVKNASSNSDAKLLAEAIGNSLLCKTAWFGGDPNWGRLVAALGYAGVEFDPSKVDVYYDEFQVVHNGGDAGTEESLLAQVLAKREFTVTADMHAGNGEFFIWTCDISYEYVKINAEYHT